MLKFIECACWTLSLLIDPDIVISHETFPDILASLQLVAPHSATAMLQLAQLKTA